MTERKLSPEQYFPKLAAEQATYFRDAIEQLPIFTLSSAFDKAKSLWSNVEGVSDFASLTKKEKDEVVNTYLEEGLSYLICDAESEFVSITAKRLRAFWEEKKLTSHHTPDLKAAITNEVRDDVDPHIIKAQWPDKVDYAIIYVPGESDGFDGYYERPKILIPHKWVEIANKKPLLALAFLLRAASFARDDYFNYLQGSNTISSSEIGAEGKMHWAYTWKARAEDLISELLVQGYNYDQNVHGIAVNLDNYHYNFLLHPYIGYAPKTISGHLFYKDPGK